MRLLLLPLNPLNNAVLHVFFFFFNLKLEEKSRKPFPFPNSFHNLFQSHRQILTKLNFKSLGEREQRRNKNKSSFALLLIWYLFLSHLLSSITFSFSLPLSVPNSHSKFLFEFLLSKPSLNCSNLGAMKSHNLCFLYVSVAFRFGFEFETMLIWGIAVIIYLSLNIYKIIIIFFGIEFCWISWGKVREAISLRRRLNRTNQRPARRRRRLRLLRSSWGSLISWLLTLAAPLLWFWRNTRRLRLWRLQWRLRLLWNEFGKGNDPIPNFFKKKPIKQVV